jgi:hypothetical protein
MRDVGAAGRRGNIGIRAVDRQMAKAPLMSAPRHASSRALSAWFACIRLHLCGDVGLVGVHRQQSLVGVHRQQNCDLGHGGVVAGKHCLGCVGERRGQQRAEGMDELVVRSVDQRPDGVRLVLLRRLGRGGGLYS